MLAAIISNSRFRRRIASLGRVAVVGILFLIQEPLPTAAMDGFLGIRPWGSAQNLDLAMVEAAVQTSDGYLWFGSTSGLYRFNGYEFRAFDPRPGEHEDLPGITALLADRDGSLWIGTRSEGLYRLKQGVFTSYRTLEGLSNDRIKCLYQDRSGVVWVGTDGGGAFRWTHERFEPLVLPDRPPLTHPTAFGEDAEGRFWIGTFSNGAFRIREGKVDLHVRTASSLRSIQVGPDGRLWFSNPRGVAWLDGDRPRPVDLLQADGSTTNRVFVTSFCQDRWGSFWIGTLHGLIRFSSEGQEFLSGAQGLGNGLVTCVYADREGSVWVGVELGDLYQVRRQRIQIAPPFEQGLQGVHALQTDSKGALWVAGSGGLVSWEKGRRTWSPPADSLAAREVCATGTDGAGRRWFAERFGDWGILEDDGISVVSTAHLTSGQRSPKFFLQTRHHGFLVGTPDHLIRIDPGNQLVPLTTLGLSHFSINCAYEADDGTLWIGTSHGLNRLQNGKVTQYIDVSPRPIELVVDLDGDADGTLWICTYRGLWRYRNGHFFAFGPEHGLPMFVGSLVDDRRGALWGHAGTQVYRFPREELHAIAEGRKPRGQFRFWDRNDGLTKSIRAGFMFGTALPDGQVCFGTDTGVAYVAPEDPPINDVPPHPTLELVVANGEVQDWSLNGSLQPRRIELPPGYNRLEIHFAALSFLAPSRVNYSHRLLGLNDTWESAQGHRFASFRGLPPGRYLFQVNATNETGLASPEPASVEIIALTPWWNTAPARVLAALSVLVALSLMYSVRVRHLKQLGNTRREYSQRLLADQESERSRLARELHDGLGQELLIIKNQAAMLELDLPQDPALIRARLQELATTSQSAIDQARNIAHNLRPAELDRAGLAASMQAMAERAAASSPIQFDIHIDPVDGSLEKPAEVLVYRISQELVNNILKHSQARFARVELMLRPGEDEIELRVEDNGRGFPTGTAPSSQGSRPGLGLLSVQERVEMLHGIVHVESGNGGGTRWRIRIPTRRSPR